MHWIKNITDVSGCLLAPLFTFPPSVAMYISLHVSDRVDANPRKLFVASATTDNTQLPKRNQFSAEITAEVTAGWEAAQCAFISCGVVSFYMLFPSYSNMQLIRENCFLEIRAQNFRTKHSSTQFCKSHIYNKEIEVRWKEPGIFYEWQAEIYTG